MVPEQSYFRHKWLNLITIYKESKSMKLLNYSHKFGHLFSPKFETKHCENNK
jgi:hypothetical protein